MSQNEAAALARTEGNDISEDPSVHDPECHYFQYAQVHSKGLRSEEVVKQRLSKDLIRRRGRTSSEAEINNQLTKAMSPNGVISEYLKSKREMYASYKPLLKTFCHCESAKMGGIGQGHKVAELGHQETLPIGEKVEPGNLGPQKFTVDQRRTLEDVGLDLSESDEDEEQENEEQSATA